MQISWAGFGAFRIQEDKTSILFDPVEKGSDFKLRKSNTEILILSHKRTVDDLSCVSGDTFVVDGPGEYEVKGVFITGVINNGSTIYSLTIDGVKVLWLGPTKTKELSSAAQDAIHNTDILLVPVGGGEVLSAKDAVAIINQVEPRIVIPGYYKIKGSKGLDSLDNFFKEYSAPSETLEKLKIAKKDLLTEDTKVVILTP